MGVTGFWAFEIVDYFEISSAAECSGVCRMPASAASSRSRQFRRSEEQTSELQSQLVCRLKTETKIAQLVT